MCPYQLNITNYTGMGGEGKPHPLVLQKYNKVLLRGNNSGKLLIFNTFS